MFLFAVSNPVTEAAKEVLRVPGTGVTETPLLPPDTDEADNMDPPGNSYSILKLEENI